MRWILLLTLLLPTAANAVQSADLGVYPTGALSSTTPWFRYTLAPGQRTAGSITVDNRSHANQDILLYAVDAAPNGDGGFGMMPQAAHTSDAGGWIRLEQSLLHLAPQTQQAVSFWLTAPAHPSVGPHYAGIIAQPVTPRSATAGGVHIQVVSRLGVRLYLTVPGQEHPKLEITDLHKTSAPHQLKLSVSLHNEGNTLLTPSGKLTISGLLQPTTSQQFSAGRWLAPDQRATVAVPIRLASSILPRRYIAQLQLLYGEPPHQRTVTRSAIFWTGNITAWATAFAVILLTVVGFAVKYGYYRHRHRHRRD